MATIGIMDSGVGGLSVFREIRRTLPDAGFVYFADNAHCPYGDKSTIYIQDRTRVITDLMLSKGVDVIVIACNTATAASIAMLRDSYDIPFIGLEPAVKPAAMATETGIIGVLATSGTLVASKYLATRSLFEEEVKIVEHVGKGFVELVEGGELTGEHAEQVVRASVEPLIEAGADVIALGCTHYPFLLDTMKKVAADMGHPEVRFIDPAPAIARQLLKVMKERGISMEGDKASVELIASGDAAALKRTFALIQ